MANVTCRDVSDELWNTVKRIADKEGRKVEPIKTRIMEDALKRFIAENKHKDAEASL